MADITLNGLKDLIRGMLGSAEDSTQALKDKVDRIYQHTVVMEVPTDADGTFTVLYKFRAPQNMTVQSVYFLTAGTAASSSDCTTLALNKYDGAGGTATIVASKSTSVAAIAAGVPYAFANSATAANLNLTAGQVLGITGTSGAGGVAVPAGVLVVNYTET